jgi:hypothetical protein
VELATFVVDPILPAVALDVAGVVAEAVFVGSAGTAVSTVCIDVVLANFDAVGADELVVTDVCIVVVADTVATDGAVVVVPVPVFCVEELPTFVADADLMTASVKSKVRLSEFGLL